MSPVFQCPAISMPAQDILEVCPTESLVLFRSCFVLYKSWQINFFS